MFFVNVEARKVLAADGAEDVHIRGEAELPVRDEAAKSDKPLILGGEIIGLEADDKSVFHNKLEGAFIVKLCCFAVVAVRIGNLFVEVDVRPLVHVGVGG